MRRMTSLIAAAVALAAAAGPALAQSYADQQRWDAAQSRYDNETRIFQAERDRYYATSRGYRDGYRQGYGAGGPPPGYNQGYGQGYGNNAPPPGAYGADRYENGYDPARYYRAAPSQSTRVLANDDRVYRGSDGRYYCRRSDGTTGLIIGAAGGGILGNVIDGGHSRTVGTLIGGALGALVGKSVDQNSSVKCQ